MSIGPTEAAVLEALERPPEIPFADESTLGIFVVISWEIKVFYWAKSDFINMIDYVKLFGCLIDSAIFPLMYENGSIIG